MMRRLVGAFLVLATATAFEVSVAPRHGHRTAAVQCRPAAVVMKWENRDPDSRSKSREQLLPDLLKALDEVSLFIARADASRQRKPTAPSVECIEAYCAKQQRKIDLLMEEAKIMRESGGDDTKVRWTDIDGNDNNGSRVRRPRRWR